MYTRCPDFIWFSVTLRIAFGLPFTYVGWVGFHTPLRLVTVLVGLATHLWLHILRFTFTVGCCVGVVALVGWRLRWLPQFGYTRLHTHTCAVGWHLRLPLVTFTLVAGGYTFTRLPHVGGCYILHTRYVAGLVTHTFCSLPWLPHGYTSHTHTFCIFTYFPFSCLLVWLLLLVQLRPVVGCTYGYVYSTVVQLDSTHTFGYGYTHGYTFVLVVGWFPVATRLLQLVTCVVGCWLVACRVGYSWIHPICL